MSRREERATIHLDEVVVPMTARLTEAARIFGREVALQQATWEPHDWSDFA